MKINFNEKSNSIMSGSVSRFVGTPLFSQMETRARNEILELSIIKRTIIDEIHNLTES